MEQNKKLRYDAGIYCVFRKLFFSHMFSHSRRIKKLAKQRSQTINVNNDQQNVQEAPTADNKIGYEDLPKPENNQQPFDTMKQFLDKINYDENPKITDNQVIKATLQTFSKDSISLIILQITYRLMLIGMTFLFQFMIQSLENSQQRQAYLYGTGYVLLVIFSSISANNLQFQGQKLGLKMKACYISCLFKKMLSLTQYTITKKDIGRIVNMLSNDFNQIEYKAAYFTTILLSPLTFLAFSAILVYRLGNYAYICIGITALYFPIQIFLNRLIQKLTEQGNQYQDLRVRKTTQLVQKHKQIKIHGWQNIFASEIKSLRQGQLKKFIHISIFNSISTVFGENFVYFAIFLTYQLAYHNIGLTLAIVVSSLEVIVQLRQLTLDINEGMTAVADFRVFLRRFADFMCTENLKMIDIDTLKDRELCRLQIQQKIAQNMKYQSDEKLQPNQQNEFQIVLDNYLISFIQFNGKWGEQSESVLKNINLTIQKGRFYGLAGQTGSGKSSFIKALLGQMPYKKGQADIKCSISYLQQSPVLFADSIRQNIVLGKDFDQERYKEVVEISCLLTDLQRMQKGDETLVGEKGVTLSGGQKTRIAIARALYKQADLYVFDDPFASVDSKVARAIYKKVFLTFLRNQTVILSTHHTNFLQQCDQVVVFSQGSIAKQITEQDQVKQALAAIQAKQQKMNSDEQESEETEEVVHKEEIMANFVNWSLFFKYVFFKRKWLIFVALLITLLANCVIAAFIRLIGVYDQQIKNETNLTMGMYWGLGFIFIGSSSFLSFLSYFLINIHFISTNRKLHQDMLNSLIHCKSQFIDAVQIGQLQNVFSNDLGSKDQTLISIIEQILRAIIVILISFGNVAEINLFFLIPIIFVVIAIISQYQFIISLIVLSKKLDLEAKTPIYSLMNQIVVGITQIKLFSNFTLYLSKISQSITNSLKANVFFWMNIRLLSFSMIMTITLLIVVVTLLGIKIVEDVGQFSVSILFVQSILYEIHWCFYNFSQIKGLLQSTSRCFKIIELDPESEFSKEEDQTMLKLMQKWKQSNTPCIQFKNYRMRYKTDLPIILNGLSFKVHKGEKIGVVGRTGAGKSSIVQSILRLYEPEQGSLYRFKGQNALELGLHTLRHRISVIPQTPTLFSGSLAYNLDPFSSKSQDQIWTALQKAKLKDKVRNMPQGIDTIITNEDCEFSLGEKQLFCLARALLQNNDLIILDEATSSIDKQTDHEIQQILKQAFGKKTIITIAHRLGTIAHYDRILVMENGVIKEEGAPFELIQQRGLFHQMVLSSHRSAEQIVKIAKEKFEVDHKGHKK